MVIILNIKKLYNKQNGNANIQTNITLGINLYYVLENNI